MPPRAYAGYGPYAPGGTGYGRARDPHREQQLLRLALVLLQQIATMERKPPVTLLLVAVNVLFYIQPPGFEFVPGLQQGCLHAAQVLKNWQWGRLLWAPLLHADEMHLFYNMSSLLWKGAQLEPRMGALPFLRLVSELALVSNLLYVVLAAALAARWPLVGRALMGQCAVGFSAVLFGLKVILNHDSPGWSDIYGVKLPTKYVCWAELVIAQLLVPGASFWGHLCGILAGIIHVRFLGRRGPFAPMGPNGRAARGGGGTWDRLFRSLFGRARGGGGSGRARTYGHGTWGGGAASSATRTAGAGAWDQALHVGPGSSGPLAAGRSTSSGGNGVASGGEEGARGASSSTGHAAALEEEEGGRGASGGGGARGSAGGRAEGEEQRRGRVGSGGVGPPGGGGGAGDGGVWRGTSDDAWGRRSGGSSPDRAYWGSRQGAGGGGSLGGVGSAVLTVAMFSLYAVLASAWVTNPSTLDDFLCYAGRELRGSSRSSRLPGSVQQALLWAQAKTGLGVGHYDCRLFSLVGVHDRWFLGAFGAWVPLHPAIGAAAGGSAAAAAWAAWAVRRCAGEYLRGLWGLLLDPSPGVLALQAAMVACFLAWHLLPPSLALPYLEVGPGRGLGVGGASGASSGRRGEERRRWRVWRTQLVACLLAGVSHEGVLPLARSLLIVALAGSLVEQALGWQWMVVAFLASSAAVHAVADVAQRALPGPQGRRRLFGRKGAEPGLYALMLLALAQQAQHALSAAQALSASKAGGGGSLLGWLGAFLPAALVPGPAWGMLSGPLTQSVLGFLMGSRGSTPAGGPSAVVVAVLWLALEAVQPLRPTARPILGRQGAGMAGCPSNVAPHTGAGGDNRGGGSATQRSGAVGGFPLRGVFSTLLWPLALAFRVAAAALWLVLPLALAPYRAQLAAIAWIHRSALLATYLLLLASLLLGDLAAASVQRAMPGAGQQLYWALLQLGCVAAAAALLAASFGGWLWHSLK